MMPFTKSKIYILQSWKEFPKCRLCLSAFSILCLTGTESKDYQVICVLPVFSPTSAQNQIYKKSDWCFFFFFLQNSTSAFCLIFQTLYIRLQARPLWPNFVFFVRPEFFLFYEVLLPFQSMSNPADILYKKGKRIIPVLWGITNPLNRFYSTPSTEGVEVYKRKFCLCVCRFVRNHFFLLRIFNNLMI